LTFPSEYAIIRHNQERKVKIMTYEEALALATKNMAPLGYFPWEIKDAALKMLGEECAKEYVKIYGEVK